MKNILTLLLLFVTIQLVQAQDKPHFCGTPEGRSEWLKEYQKRPLDQRRSSDEELWVPIQLHIVGTDSGSGYYNINRAYNDFCELQEQFEPTNIRLYLTDEINYVNSTQLQNHASFEEGSEIMNETDFPDIINVYIAQEAAGNCGYAAFWINRVVLAVNCIGPGSTTWAHEMGHVFSLPHNFDSNSLESNDNFSVPAPDNFERVDGSNCANAGDGFCDTPPDYLGFRWGCNSENFSNRVQLDPDSVKFQSDGQYYMSYASDACMSHFSEEQIGAMRTFVQEERAYYLNNNPLFRPIIAEDIKNVVPEDEGFLDRSGDQILSWRKVKSAKEYIVEVTRFEVFSFVEFRGTVEENEFKIEGNLIDGQTYYWRVRPVNQAYVCEDYFPIRSFTVFDSGTTSTNNLSEIKDIEVFPNPISRQQQVNIRFNGMDNTQLQLEMVDLLGRKVYAEVIRTNVGDNTYTISTHQLESGIYYVVLSNNNEIWQHKVIIQ